MNITHFEHAVYALLIQLFSAWLTKNYWIGAAAAIGFSSGASMRSGNTNWAIPVTCNPGKGSIYGAGLPMHNWTCLFLVPRCSLWHGPFIYGEGGAKRNCAIRHRPDGSVVASYVRL